MNSIPRFISADSHVDPQPSMWGERIEKGFRDRAPRLEEREEGRFLVFEGNSQRISGLSSVAGKKSEDYDHESEGRRRGGWDPDARIHDQDLDNVAAEVLYGGSAILNTKDRELRGALSRAYNDWLADFCASHPSRLIGIGEIPMWDIDLAIAEARRLREKGLRGVLIPSIPTIEGPWSTPADRNYTDPWYEPLWSALEDLDLSVNMHLGARPLTEGLDYKQNAMIAIVCNKAMMAEPITSFIFSGVLQRHPRLKVVSVESGVGWMAFLVQWMDAVFEKHRHWTKSPLTEPPSFYFHRQVLGTFIEDPVGVNERHVIGLGNIMWSNDYPHADSTWPHSRKSVEEHFAGVPDEERNQICAGNAAALYGIDLALANGGKAG